MMTIDDKDQRLLLASMKNARELGGFLANDQKMTAFGQFIRSDAPLGMNEDELDALLAYPVSDVLDLRSKEEIERTPTPFIDHPSITWTYIPLLPDDPESPNSKAIKLAVKTSLGELYIYFLEHRRQTFVEIFDLLSAPRKGALLFHCTHGKDRTGLIAALLLKLVGVENASIVHSYKVSYDYLRPIVDPLIARIPRKIHHLYRSDEANIMRVLNYLDEKYQGSANDYLVSAGVSQKTLALLKQKLLR